MSIEAALSLARAGFAVFPANRHDKTPCITGWQEAASRDEDAVRDLWRRLPDANPAIRTGERADLFIVDADVKDHGLDKWRALLRAHGEVSTFVVRTGGGGEHWYFRWPDFPVPTRRSQPWGPGIDTRGAGGYAIGPGAIHGDTGAVYDAGDETDDDGLVLPDVRDRIAEAPDWLLAELRPQERTPAPDDGRGIDGPRAERRVQGYLARCERPDGGRHPGMIGCAVKLLANVGPARDLFEREMRAWFTSVYPDKTDAREIDGILAWAWEHAPRPAAPPQPTDEANGYALVLLSAQRTKRGAKARYSVLKHGEETGLVLDAKTNAPDAAAKRLAEMIADHEGGIDASIKRDLRNLARHAIDPAEVSALLAEQEAALAVDDDAPDLVAVACDYWLRRLRPVCRGEGATLICDHDGDGRVLQYSEFRDAHPPGLLEALRAAREVKASATRVAVSGFYSKATKAVWGALREAVPDEIGAENQGAGSPAARLFLRSFMGVMHAGHFRADSGETGGVRISLRGMIEGAARGPSPGWRRVAPGVSAWVRAKRRPDRDDDGHAKLEAGLVEIAIRPGIVGGELGRARMRNHRHFAELAERYGLLADRSEPDRRTRLIRIGAERARVLVLADWVAHLLLFDDPDVPPEQVPVTNSGGSERHR